MEWYVLFVQSGKEESVLKWIEFYFSKKSLYAFAPLRKLKEKRGGKVFYAYRFLFPGYIFIRTQMDIGKYYILNSIPGLLKILGERGKCYQIREEEISIILKLIGETNIINCSKICIKDSAVKIVSGPLCGLEGIITKIDKHRNRAKILLTLMGEARIIDVGIEYSK